MAWFVCMQYSPRAVSIYNGPRCVVDRSADLGEVMDALGPPSPITEALLEQAAKGLVSSALDH